MKRLIAALYLTAAVAASGADRVPAPEEIFGFKPGADYKLADYNMMLEYYRRLDAASPRVSVIDIGPTAEGRRMILAIISSEQNIVRLDRFREISRSLALARGLDDQRAKQLAREGRAVVWIDGGLHASEVAHAQHSPELAYRVATEESDEMRSIRENVILLQVPVMNPDGLDLVVNWYRRNLGTPYEVSPLVELYHKYVGHDNNRDWYMFTQPESRNVARLLYHEWFPQIVYNHHQSAPFPARIFVPPFDDPMNPNIPPLVMRGVHLIGEAMSARFEREGKPGVISRIGFDTWWNGGMRTAPYFHNMIGILTETALFRYATPKEYKSTDLPDKFPNGLPAKEPSTFYPHPWPGGWWRLRDAVDYMLTASLAVLDTAAKYRQDLLYNIYILGKSAIEKGSKEPPYAYIIPEDQWDPSAAAELIRALLMGGVEIERASEPFSAGGKQYPAGSYVIRSAQPFRAYVKDLLEPQRYPDRRKYEGGPPLPPYDMAGWTLPLQMGVGVEKIEKPFEAKLAPVVKVEPGAFDPGPSDFGYILDGRSNQAFAAVNRLLAAGVRVRRAARAFAYDGREFSAGSFVVDAGQKARSMLRELSSEYFIRVQAAQKPLSAELFDIRPKRVGIYRSWIANMDEGWTRWLLERYGFEYRSLVDAELRRGGLESSFDVIVLPSQSSRAMVNGHPQGLVPPEFVGGMGAEGVSALKKFVADGGRLVALDQAAELILDNFPLPMRNVVEREPQYDFYCPGSLLALEVDAAQRLAFGMPSKATAFFVNSGAFDTIRFEDEKMKSAAPQFRVAASYAKEGMLQSGWIIGEKKIAGKWAAFEVPFGRGEIVVIAFRSQFRGQPHGTFKLLFNALLN